MKSTILLLKDCLEVLNRIPNRSYWSHMENRESKTYSLANKVEKEIDRLRSLDSSGK